LDSFRRKKENEYVSYEREKKKKRAKNENERTERRGTPRDHRQRGRNHRRGGRRTPTTFLMRRHDDENDDRDFFVRGMTRRKRRIFEAKKERKSRLSKAPWSKIHSLRLCQNDDDVSERNKESHVYTLVAMAHFTWSRPTVREGGGL
jgi:hypothetical protein